MNLLRCFALFTLLLTAASPAVRAQSTDLRPFMGREDVWPRNVTLKVGVAAGKGQAAIPAGAVVKVVGVEGSLIGVEYQGTLTMVPVAQTDFIALAAAALEQNPTPPPRKVAPPAAPTRPPPLPSTGSTGPHALGVHLEKALLFGDGSKIPPGEVNLAGRDFILLEFGGGNRWGAAMKELLGVVMAARERRASFEVVQVPIPGMSVANAGELMKENGARWATVDPTDQRLIGALWNNYGHAGTFALALVDRKGTIVAKTIPKEKSVDDFHAVLAALARIE